MESEGKYILVTGAAGGMGRAFVERAEHAGYSLFALDITFPPDYPKGNIIPILCDITSSESIEKAEKEVRKYTDTLYGVVHFAGIYRMDSLVEITEREWDRIFAVNVRGPYLVNKFFIEMIEKGGRIIMTTSELAPLRPLPFTGIYAVTKSALDKYAFSLLMEVQLLGIHVSVIRPGAVKTKMLDKSTTELDAFTTGTKLYKTNAARFRKIVDSVETKAVEPLLVAEKALKILEKKRPGFSYRINNNKMLRLTALIPARLELYIIKKILQ